TDDQTLSSDGSAGNLSIEDGNTLTLNVNDADADPTNEIQDLSLTGNNLTITNNGSATTIDLSGYLDNTDDQQITDFSLDAATNVLTLTLEDGGSQTVDLSGFVSSDDQALSSDGTAGNISIEDGNTLTLNVNDADADATNELNTGFAINGTDLELTDAGGTLAVPLSAIGSDDQDLTGATIDASNVLTLSIEDGASTTVDLSAYLDNTDDQQITDFSLSGNDLSIALEDGGTQTVSLASLSSTDDQNLSSDGSAGNLSIEDGNTLTLNVNDADADPTNEIQDLSLTGNTLTITNNGAATAIDLSPYLTNTDNQDATQVNLAPALDVDGDGTNETTVQQAIEAFENPVKAMGKVAANGTALKIKGATVTRVNPGDYQVTFTNVRPDANYVIQLTLRDSAGIGNDAYGISYYNQLPGGFRVNIGDDDNGAGNRIDRDFEFMFMVLDF
ncbi:hypothetical protein, partial [Ostreibacterium oceani]|uniref:hypothetical protein n=1 Tax=Ostreibacterium oceani TaxID=2654998 RepID=UPI001C402E7B